MGSAAVQGRQSKKYIFVTGGVISGLGKGIVAASLGRLLKSRGYSISMQKFDPYLNVDAGTNNPFEHGEVFVTEDGAEADLDLGHYERFIDEELTRGGNVSSGSIYYNVIDKERQGVFDGATVQIVPHITNEIKELISKDAPGADIAIVEIGGTVGDIESMVFIEAIRQFSNDIGRQNCAFVHVVLLPYIQASGEQKTKPAQHSVKELLGQGISPDFIVCRSERPLTDDAKEKIALFCNVPLRHVVTNMDVESIYEVPLHLHAEGLDAEVLTRLGLDTREPDLGEWRCMVENLKSVKNKRKVTVALVGKYTGGSDAYFSVFESLRHSGARLGADVAIKSVDSEKITRQTVRRLLGGADAVIVPGGFGSRGVEGMILAARFARENKVPYFGIGLGMEVAAVEFARGVLGYEDAASAQCDPASAHLVFDLMPGQKNLRKRGGTMRLGSYPCELADGSAAQRCYGGLGRVGERHRHRYGFNNAFRAEFEAAGAVLAGRSPDDKIIEIIELGRDLHPWYVSVQFHPEFKSRPNKPHPLFCGFIEAALVNMAAGEFAAAGGSADASSVPDSQTAGVSGGPADKKPGEACGVFAVYSDAGDAVPVTQNALFSLQHRGQESAGIAALADHGAILCHKGPGLVTAVFAEGAGLPAGGKCAIGHVRYSTAATRSYADIQPCISEYLRGRVASANNGNITNKEALRQKLVGRGAAFMTHSDSEVISSLVAFEALTAGSFEDAAARAAEQLEGAFSLVLLSHEGKLVALRDGWGFRPLCIGRNEYGYAVASESCALDSLGYAFLRDVRPGEMVVIDKSGFRSAGIVLNRPLKGVCIFEYVYFARPDSIIDGQSVYDAHVRMGEILAREYAVDADVVCGVPESGLDAATGYGRASGIEVRSGFVKNRYIGRSFIYPTQSQRETAVRLKLNPIVQNVAGKRVVLVDDSMVRGTTCARIIKSLKAAGAKEVHVRIASPQFLHKCDFGTDIDEEDTLIANTMSIESIREMIGADSLGFISLKGLHEACGDVRVPLCDGCISGEYPTD